MGYRLQATGTTKYVGAYGFMPTVSVITLTARSSTLQVQEMAAIQSEKKVRVLHSLWNVLKL